MDKEISRRIVQIRNEKKLTQSEFADKIGIKQAGISAIEKGIRGVTDRNISLICEKFNVNEQWLRTGVGEMYNEYESIIDEINENYFDLDEREQAIAKSFLSMGHEKRTVIVDYFLDVIKRFADIDEKEKGVENRQVKDE